MSKIISIKQNRDFRRTYSKGKSYVSPMLVTYVSKNHTGEVRIGITTSKKIGNAVDRNRSRRIIREACRQIYPSIKFGTDLIFVARAKTSLLKSTDIKQIMSEQLKQAGVLQ